MSADAKVPEFWRKRAAWWIFPEFPTLIESAAARIKCIRYNKDLYHILADNSEDRVYKEYGITPV
jgi:hypothetical protein